VILCNANAKHKEEEYIEILKDKLVDGIIFHHLNITVRQAMDLDNAGIKCIYIDNEKPLVNVTNMLLDQKDGAYIATKHLIDMGHRNIGIVHGALAFDEQKKDLAYEHTFQFSIWNQRLEGYLKAMKDCGLEVNQKYMLEAEGGANRGIMSGKEAIMKMIGGREGVRRFLDTEDRPTAIYAQNDQMAIGVINGAIECGCRVPEDLSVIGQDGLDIGKSLYPQLTTVRQPRYEIGYKAAEKLINLIENDEKNSTMHINSELVVRQSTQRLV
jgi:LacI family transcriptional regulator